MSNRNNKSTNKKNSGTSAQNRASRSAKKAKGGSQSTRPISRKPIPVSTAMVVRQQNYRKKPNYIVSHTEYIGDIAANVERFHFLQKIILNPGDPDSFPWCSQFGNLYESYIFKKLRFRYEPSCSTATQGYVAFVPDFNPLEPGPINKQQAFQNEKTVRGSPFTHFSVDFTQQQLNKRKSYFARSGAEVVDQANREVYDTGNLFVFVGGCVDNSTVLGEIWVDYEVEFMTPEAPTQVLQTTTYTNSNTTTSTFNPFRAGVVGSVLNSNLNENAFTFSDGDGASSRITFNKPFQGIITSVLNGSGFTANLSKVFGGGAESSVHPELASLNKSLLSHLGTSVLATTALNAPVGGFLELYYNASLTSLTDSLLSITSANVPALLMNGLN